MSTAIDIATYLQVQGYGTVGTEIFYGFMPDDPNDAICVYETSGRPSELHRIDQPNFQIVVRRGSITNPGYLSCSITIESINTLLHNITNTVINGTFYININNLQAPFATGYGPEGRAEFKQNYTTQKR